MDLAFAHFTGAARGEPAELARLGRAIAIPQAVGAVARFDFDALFRRPLSAGDYVALASRFATFFVDHVPVLTDDERDATKRFINFIDAAYDARAKLIVSAAAEPDALGASFERSRGVRIRPHRFAADRDASAKTISRCRMTAAAPTGPAISAELLPAERIRNRRFI